MSHEWGVVVDAQTRPVRNNSNLAAHAMYYTRNDFDVIIIGLFTIYKSSILLICLTRRPLRPIPNMNVQRTILLYTALILSAIIHRSLQADTSMCEGARFGVPNRQDCLEAMFWIPYHNKPASITLDARALHIFAEPRLLSPPFKGIKNKEAPRAVVQLPKIWKFGESNRIGA